MSEIPVLRLRPDGSPTTDPYLGAPCIRLQYSFQKAAHKPEGGLEVYGIHSAMALLDTGADYNLICETLIPPTAHFVENVKTSGVTGSRQARNYRVTFYLPEADLFHETGIISMEARSGRPYAIILGRKFLQSTRFQYAGHLGIVGLEFFSNPNAR